MENKGVCCDVCECVHNCCSNKCNLETIQVTKQSADKAMSTPHFCKSFEQK